MSSDEAADANAQSDKDDTMGPEPTTVPISEDLEVEAKIGKARKDKAFMDRVKELIERDREILDRLAE